MPYFSAYGVQKSCRLAKIFLFTMKWAIVSERYAAR